MNLSKSDWIEPVEPVPKPKRPGAAADTEGIKHGGFRSVVETEPPNVTVPTTPITAIITLLPWSCAPQGILNGAVLLTSMHWKPKPCAFDTTAPLTTVTDANSLI